ncbi:hypothetical protein RHMOL_Rhmol01G0094200 [Rhododendron molle]|uniref:Uncharacterized protein n=1 Tax=Rhododendron molle TaxID=49168 RepID=A0ACC0Q1H4_RHOML|nr:hypothetical protein RHMOL_Rhmol01G0094200 [Rhododendron molle]
MFNISLAVESHFCFWVFRVDQGTAAIAAVVVIVLMVLANYPAAKLQHKYLAKLMMAQDRRLRAVAEALTNMKVLKLYAWETHFKNAVEKNRYAKKMRDAEGLNQAMFISTTRISWDSSSLKPTLNDINLVVHCGEKIAACGEVGSGKSTLIAAILGEVPDINGVVLRPIKGDFDTMDMPRGSPSFQGQVAKCHRSPMIKIRSIK